MLGNVFVDCVLLFLICYALVSIFYNVSDFLLRRYCKYPQRSFLTLKLKHESESLERDIRCAISKSLSERHALLVVCDDLSQDEYKVVWRLTDVYENIILTTCDELSDKLDFATDISMSL